MTWHARNLDILSKFSDIHTYGLIVNTSWLRDLNVKKKKVVLKRWKEGCEVIGWGCRRLHRRIYCVSDRSWAWALDNFESWRSAENDEQEDVFGGKILGFVWKWKRIAWFSREGFKLRAFGLCSDWWDRDEGKLHRLMQQWSLLFRLAIQCQSVKFQRVLIC